MDCTGAELLFRIISVGSYASKEAAKKIRDIKKSYSNARDKKFVAEPDIESEKIIRKHLRANFPDLKLETEKGIEIDDGNELKSKFLNGVHEVESSEIESLKKTRPDYEQITQKNLVVWIDPLDGTNDLRKKDDTDLDEVTILIGIAHKGNPIASIITQPFFEKSSNHFVTSIIWGICGLGVHHNEHLLTKNDFEKHNDLGRKKIVTSKTHISKGMVESLRNIPNSKIIQNDSFGYSALLLIFGKVDACIFPGTLAKCYNSCAPEAIIRSAGGECTNIFNDRYDYSNIHEEYNRKLGLVITLENHIFHIKNISKEIKNDIWEESINS